MGGVEFDPLAVLQRGDADQRHVVEMNYIILIVFQQLLDFLFLEKRNACLLCGEGRQESCVTFEPVDLHTGVVWKISLKSVFLKQLEGVFAVNHVHRMTAAREFVGQAVNVDAVTSKIVGWIKGRYHAKTQRCFDHTFPALISFTTFPVYLEAALREYLTERFSNIKVSTVTLNIPIIVRMPSGNGQHKASWRSAFLVFAGSLFLFCTSATQFSFRVTDLSALRILDGQIPYLDFWTIYAPGSMYATAAAFAVFGRNLIVSNLLGILVSALGVTLYYKLVSRVASVGAAAVAAFLFASAIYNTRYHLGLTSYPPAILCIWIGASRLADFVESGKRMSLLFAGISFGICTLFKHDLGFYACIAGAVTLSFAPVVGQHREALNRIKAIATLAIVVLTVLLPVALVFYFLAGHDLIQDLVLFPIFDFPWARAESFPPVIPYHITFKPDLNTVYTTTWWAICNFPLFLVVPSLPLLNRIRKKVQPGQAALIIFSLAGLPLFWHAAHVQTNTHANTLTALAALVGAAAFFSTRSILRFVPAALICLWFLILLAQPVYLLQERLRKGEEFVNLPHLAGIRASPRDAAWMRRLDSAIQKAAPSDRALLVLSNRNDVVVYCEGVPYWLSDRKMITRYHELHPGVTDTFAVQQEMLSDLTAAALPVVVREHRFPNLERAKKRLAERLPVGATMLDDWIKTYYLPGQKFSKYEVLRLKEEE